MPSSFPAGFGENGPGEEPFLRSALVIGVDALDTAVARFGEPAIATDPGPPRRAGRQHAWVADSVPDGDDPGSPDEGEDTPGETASYHLLLSLTCAGEVPVEDDRETVERALSGLEDAFGWGPDGLLFAVGYTGRYFDRFDDPLPEAVRSAPAVGNEGFRSPDHDALLHLAGDDPRRLLAAEAALWGRDSPVDASLEASFQGVFEVDPDAGRRAGVAPSGAISTAERTGIGGDAGPFAGGAVAHCSTFPPKGPAVETPDGVASRSVGFLDPGDAARARIDLTGLETDPGRPATARRRETYLLPPVANRALPVPRTK